VAKFTARRDSRPESDSFRQREGIRHTLCNPCDTTRRSDGTRI
jgi:hypothetical protein